MRIATLVILGLTLAACGGKHAATPSPAAGKLADPTSESIGGISIGLDAAAVEQLLGAPESKGEMVTWEATGERTADWAWPAKGVKLAMGDTGGAIVVSSIGIAAPSTLTTSRGVGVGTSRAEVERIYQAFLGTGREDGEPDTSSPEQLIIGSLYGGTFFRFVDGKVSEIFVGAGAE